MIEILTAAAVFGFSLGFSQEMAKDLRRMIRRHRRPFRMGPPRGSNGNCVPMPPSTPAPRMRRVYYDMPSTIAECGGPCSFGGPELCDCGALWRDVPTKPQFPSPRKIREDFLP